MCSSDLFAMVLKFARGVAAYVSGRMAKLAPDAIRLETPSAIVGVRGTTVAIRVEYSGFDFRGCKEEQAPVRMLNDSLGRRVFLAERVRHVTNHLVRYVNRGDALALRPTHDAKVS